MLDVPDAGLGVDVPDASLGVPDVVDTDVDVDVPDAGVDVDVPDASLGVPDVVDIDVDVDVPDAGVGVDVGPLNADSYPDCGRDSLVFSSPRRMHFESRIDHTNVVFGCWLLHVLRDLTSAKLPIHLD
jgi:hypothetical protein